MHVLYVLYVLYIMLKKKTGVTGLNWYMCSATLLARVTVTWCTRHTSAPSEGRRADRGDRYMWPPHDRTEHR